MERNWRHWIKEFQAPAWLDKEERKRPMCLDEKAPQGLSRHDFCPTFLAAMSTTEILEELPKLKLADRWAILQRLSELETREESDPSPEMVAAIEAGLRSAQNEPCYTVEEVRDKARQWARRSS